MNEILNSKTFISFSRELNNAIQWLKENGIRFDSSRITKYSRNIEALVELHKSKEIERNKEKWDDYFGAIDEANELCQIYTGLKSQPSKYISDRLKMYIKGPEKYRDENLSKGSNKSRNFGYELVVLSLLAKAQFIIDYSKGSDVAFKYKSITYLTECKRIQSPKKIKKNLKDAHQQICKKISIKNGSFLKGIIALDITKLENPEFGVLTCNSSREIGATLERIINSFTERYGSDIERYLDKKVVGVIIRLSGIILNLEQDSKMTYCQQFGFVASRKSSTDYKKVFQSISEQIVN